MPWRYTADMRILAIESSCDDTAVAVVEKGRAVLAHGVASQLETHLPYGGVIPELAARSHLHAINPLVDSVLAQAELTLNEVDAFAATLGPGLIGSLLVGVSTAKGLALACNKPFLGVHHLYGHVASNYLESELAPPFLCLLVSGGHTQLVHVKSFTEMAILGQTLDDAVGEAYDKIARLMGLPYPGGPLLDKLAQSGNPKAFELPIAQTQGAYDFSFSGLKTATQRLHQAQLEANQEQGLPESAHHADLAASFQQTVVNTLLKKTLKCARSLGLNTLSVAGGVSANKGLRSAFSALETQGYQVHLPKLAYCTDNAAMIGASAYFNPITEQLDLDVFSRG